MASEAGRRPEPGLAMLRLTQARINVAASVLRRALHETREPSARSRVLPAYVEIVIASGDVASAHAGADELSQIAEDSTLRARPHASACLEKEPDMTDPHEETSQYGEQTAPVEAWDAIAALYDEHVAPGESELATAGLRLVGVQAGDTFLDIAAGPGGLSLPAARLGAKVLATDWSARMIEHLNARARAEGLDVEGRVMDCHALELPDDTYDIAGSQFGVMLVPDQAQALREMVRVTRPGGRVLLIVYGNPGQFEALHFFISAVQAVLPEFEGPPEDEPMFEFQVADPDVLTQRLIDAGLRDVTVDTAHQERITVRTGRQLWDWCLGSNPIPGMLVADLTDGQRADIIRVLDGMVHERSGGNRPAVLTAPLNIGVGIK